ncbi:MAG: SDR family NAD(P)-dependent oxidoreductase [Polyangia bacterium]|nr:SDR family NAD(P)-dependent oxidoreductase [Polyangia bacterium]
MKKIDEKKIAKAFEGKSVILTGAAGGLGSCMARILAPYWKSALLLDLNGEGLKALVSELSKVSKGKVHSRMVDLTNEKSIEEATSKLPADLARPDVLINNAGISIMSLAEKQPLSDYRKMMEVNYFAVIALINRFLPGMLERSDGRLVTIASGSGVLANYGGAGYCASKFAIVGYMESLRQELAGTGVKTNTVLLPTVMTEFHQRVLDGEFGDMAKGLPTITPQVAAEELLRQAAANTEVISFTPTLKAGLAANGIAPSILRLGMTVNGYMLNKKRGRAKKGLLSIKG